MTGTDGENGLSEKDMNFKAPDETGAQPAPESAPPIGSVSVDTSQTEGPRGIEALMADRQRYKELNDYYNDIFVELRGASQMLEDALKRNPHQPPNFETPAEIIRKVIQRADADPRFRQDSIVYLQDEVQRPYFPRLAQRILEAMTG